MAKLRYKWKDGRRAGQEIVLACALFCVASGAIAQETEEPLAKPTKTLVIDGSDREPASSDWSVLARAMRRLVLSPSFSYEGDVELAGEGNGLNYAGRERVRFLGKRPGKVRADVMLTRGNAPSGNRYKTISDGETLWVQEVDRKRYSAKPLLDDELTGNLQRIGILGWLYFNESLLTGLSQMTDGNAEAFLASLKKAGITLTADTGSVEDEALPVYTLDLTRTGRKFRFFIEPKSAMVRQIEVTTREKGGVFRMTETILRQSAGPVVPKNAFSFVPAKGYKAVDNVPVELF